MNPAAEAPFRLAALRRTSRKALMNHPAFEAWRPRARRRILVAANLATGALLIGLMALLYAGSRWWIAAIVPTLGLWVVLTGLLNASVRGLTELRVADLDEREAPLRDRAYARLWWPTLILAFGTAWALIAGGVDPEAALPLLLGAWLVALGLPVFWLAWTLPDEPPAD